MLIFEKSRPGRGCDLLPECDVEVTLPQDLSEYHLRIVSEHEWYHFYCGQGADTAYLGKARAKYLSTEVAGGFTGVLLAMYVIDETGKKAEFTEFTWTQKGH